MMWRAKRRHAFSTIVHAQYKNYEEVTYGPGVRKKSILNPEFVEAQWFKP
jgi:hypothetical protein